MEYLLLFIVDNNVTGLLSVIFSLSKIEIIVIIVHSIIARVFT